MSATELSERIRSEVESIALVDTHEHLISEASKLGGKIDVFQWILSHYTAGDMIGAGMTPEAVAGLRDATRPLDERWAQMAPFWCHTRTTGHGRALLLATRDLFAIEDINDHTLAELAQRLAAAYRPGWYRHVLNERANISLAILDPLEKEDPTPLEEIDRSLFAPVIRMDDYVAISNLLDLKRLEAKTGVSIHALDDVLKAMDVAFERAVKAGVVAVKIAVAYCRSLLFEKVTHADAERVFNRLALYPLHLADPPLAPVSWAEAKPLQDFLMHQVERHAIAYQLPIQVHTGLQAGNGNFVANANPLLLVNLLLEYREATFDLLHAGYPYQSEMATLGKYFNNAYVDMCWLHVISPWVARQTLHEWIEVIPANKILAFGGDYRAVEGTYAHACIARRNLAEVLTQKVQDGYLSEDEAVVLAHKLLRHNAVRLFRLPCQGDRACDPASIPASMES